MRKGTMAAAFCFLLAVLVAAVVPVKAAGEIAAFSEAIRDAGTVREEMQDRYGITILLGDECLNQTETEICEVSGTPPAKTPLQFLMGYDVDMEELRRLDAALAMYPEGFLQSLRDEDAPKGLRILIAGQINGKDLSWNPAGFTTCEGSWYNVFLAHSRFTGSTVHHELWHVMEKIIMARQPGAFLIWDALNPEGFQYSNDNAAAWADYDPDYFVSGYSTVNAMEDRATIAEAVFREDREEWFAERPGLRRKLDAMNLALKSFSLIQYTLSRPGR